MCPYITFGDGTEVVHSQIIHDDGVDKVLVHFERPREDGFDFAHCELPNYTWTDWRVISRSKRKPSSRSFFATTSTCSIATRPAGVCELPGLFLVGGYGVFFWSNEYGDPIHVHVCKGVPSPNATKLWPTRGGE